MVTVARVLVALAGLALSASIVWAGFVQGANLLSEGARILELSWGVVTLVDLYVGFLIIAVVIAALEPRAWVAALWIAPLPFLGNVVAALWVVVRLPVVMRRFVRA